MATALFTIGNRNWWGEFKLCCNLLFLPEIAKKIGKILFILEIHSLFSMSTKTLLFYDISPRLFFLSWSILFFGFDLKRIILLLAGKFEIPVLDNQKNISEKWEIKCIVLSGNKCITCDKKYLLYWR